MQADVWISMIIYTTATVAFYLLGSAVLHGKGLKVEGNKMIATLSHMYQESFGSLGLGLFLVGALFVLYSTLFVATASNARLFVDASGLLGLMKVDQKARRDLLIRRVSALLPLVSLVLFLIWGSPVKLVFIGAVAQGLMLPFLAGAALYYRFRGTPAGLQPGLVWTILLGISALCMAILGGYQVYLKIAAGLNY